MNLQTPLSKVWLRAAAGVGKSFLCAYAIQQIAVINPTAFSIFQYYSFDNDFKALGVYRCLAEQLVDQLWTQLEDMPEDIHAHTQRSSASYKLEDVKALIRMLLDRRSATYIFLDGLDEQCDSNQQRIELSEVLNFLSELATDGSRCVRLWCSSQERAYLKSTLSNFSVIEVNKEQIYDDIKLHLSKRILELDRLELDKGYQNLILSDLSEKADGCFLWASLMLGWISKAATLDTVQELIREGLPSDYEKYYEKKIESIDASQRALVS